MSASELGRFAEIVRSGGVVLIPTDTVYGVAAALARIVEAKGRDPRKPCQLLASGVAAVERLGLATGPCARAVMEAFWPGALTLVLDAPGGGTEGARVPAHEAARALCEAAGGLLRCTSANRSGEKPAVSAEEAAAALPSADALVDAGPSPGGVSSTVAAVSADGSVRMFREGPIGRAALEAAATNRA